MLISGSLKELRSFIDRASMTGADYISFIAPNQVLIVHHTRDEYSYFKTNLFISHSVVLSKVGFTNLKKFIKLTWGARRNNPDSPYYRILGETISVTPQTVKFDNNPEFEYEFEIDFTPIEAVSTIDLKIAQLKVSAIDLDFPFLKLSPRLLKKIYRRMNSKTERLLTKKNHMNLNEFYMKDRSNLVFDRLDGEHCFEYITDEEKEQSFEQEFMIFQDFLKARFPIYDMDILTLYKAGRIWPIENIVLIPHKNFYIAEAHTEEQMVAKLHMKLTYFDKKSILSK